MTYDQAPPDTAPHNLVLQVRNLRKEYGGRAGIFRRATAPVRAVNDVSFDLRHGETLGLVGESGCGKTSLGRCIVRAIRTSGGQILFSDPTGRRPQVDFATLKGAELQSYRRDVQMVFQDPVASLNPRMTLLEIIGEPMIVNRVAEGVEVKRRVGDLLERVGLRADHMNRYPHAFSGGQRQRIGIARALALDPKVIVCDEPVSALDVSVQAQILNLLQDLQAEAGLSYLFIAHDLGVMEYICDRVAVMYLGQIVELADTDALFRRPLHPYSEALMSAVPVPDPDAPVEPKLLKGEPGNAAALPDGCAFHPRCAYAIDTCRTVKPELETGADGRSVRCHRARELSLQSMSGLAGVR